MGARGWLLGAVLGFAAAFACNVDEDLENKLCASDADCWTNQECIATDFQTQGWCRPKGSDCAKGVQPGCACDVMTDGSSPMCEYNLFAVDPDTHYETDDPLACICVEMGYVETPDTSSGSSG